MTEPSNLARVRALHAAGEHLAAEAAVLGLLERGSASATTYRLLASIECALGRSAREALALEHALAAAPNDAAAWRRLAALRASSGDANGAAEAYEGAVKAAPDDPIGRELLLRARFAEGHLEQSQQLAEQFAARFPESAIPDLLAGHIEKALGNTEHARVRYQRALVREPTSGEAIYNLVDLQVPAPDSSLAAHAASISASTGTAPADRINAAFAGARILDGAERYAEAMAQYRVANDLAKGALDAKGIKYSAGEAEARVDEIIETYPSPDFVNGLAPLPIELTPIFVIGLPRSGTTLIEQIISAHPLAESAGELSLGRTCEREFRAHRRAAGRTGPVDVTHSIDRRGLEEARERYLDGLLERDLDGPWVIDKLPANFEIAGFLRLLFPQAPILHSQRDPRATCFSLYCANFGAHEPYYHDLTSLAHYCRQYQRLMRHWHKTMPRAIFDISYEDLVRAPNREIPALLERLGLPSREECLNFHLHVRPVLTASHAQVRQPMNPRAIYHWQRYQDWLGPLLELNRQQS